VVDRDGKVQIWNAFMENHSERKHAEVAAPGAFNVAERIRHSVQALVVEQDDQQIRFTVSLGIAEVSEEMNSHQQLVEIADRALYDAKHAGRNTTRIACEPLDAAAGTAH